MQELLAQAKREHQELADTEVGAQEVLVLTPGLLEVLEGAQADLVTMLLYQESMGCLGEVPVEGLEMA